MRAELRNQKGVFTYEDGTGWSADTAEAKKQLQEARDLAFSAVHVLEVLRDKFGAKVIRAEPDSRPVPKGRVY